MPFFLTDFSLWRLVLGPAAPAVGVPLAWPSPCPRAPCPAWSFRVSLLGSSGQLVTRGEN